MNIVVINGTAVRGVTYHMKEFFLQRIGGNASVTEFYPQDLPGFCTGCKACFLRGEALCPHREQTDPIWRAFLQADLIVFAYPVYALRAPASIKSLLDHFCVHWMVHRPEEKLFSKTAVILTNSVGAPNGSAQKDVKTSLAWMGVSRVYARGAGMMGDIFWETITPEHRAMLERKSARMARRVGECVPVKRMRLPVRARFWACKRMHQMTLKGEDTPSLDNQHYLDRGWIEKK